MDIRRRNRKVQNGLALAGSVAVLLGLMFVTSLVASNVPAGF
ncbi:MAG: hypothetical protein R3288_09750 [Woeseiaceae bacterium]|nr:hypothetical protein [Woeseiaceae bacterium]